LVILTTAVPKNQGGVSVFRASQITALCKNSLRTSTNDHRTLWKKIGGGETGEKELVISYSNTRSKVEKNPKCNAEVLGPNKRQAMPLKTFKGRGGWFTKKNIQKGQSKGK